MQLQLFIQMLSGGAGDRRRDAFQGKPRAFLSRPQKNNLYKNPEGIYCRFTVLYLNGGVRWLKAERIAAVKASWVIGAQQHHIA